MLFPIRFCFLAFLLICFSPTLAASSGDLATDAEALLAFKGALETSNNSTPLLASWNASTTSTSICINWTGITCSNSSSSPRVIAIDLAGASLSGHIAPSTIGLLDALQNLSLSSNRFSGELPSDLANCTSLTGLFLQSNSFSGSLPASAFLFWADLLQIDLSFNGFNGSIPSSIANATLLQSVNLQNNSFSGRIPDVSSASLRSFNVANNELEGQIPSSLSGFSPLSFAGNGDLCGKPLNETCSAGPPTSTPSTNPSKKKTLGNGAIAGIIIVSVLGGCLLLLFVVRRARHCRLSSRSPSGKVEPDIERSTSSTGEGLNGEIPSPSIGEPTLVYVDRESREAFDMNSLVGASAEMMGKGGSLGDAYKAMLESGLIVVVKRLNFKYRGDYRGHLNVLGGFKHENLVPIKAWFFFEDEKLLVYDYIQGTSLHSLLHGELSSSFHGPTMEWEKRLQVAWEVASALAYMHEQHVVHGNIKSSNVVIDSENRARLTNYGLVQVAMDLPHASSERNSNGYTAPEISDLSRTTFKSDVYSFGVLLLELLTGRSPMSDGDRHNLPRWVRSVAREQWAAEVFALDVMKFEYIQEEMIELLQIALQCVSSSPNQRPSMSDLIKAIDALRCSDDDESVNSQKCNPIPRLG